MSTREQLYFEVSARLQKVLGQDLIADNYVAIAEFVKNGYDAYAEEVTIDFRVSAPSTSEHQIIISDNGEGMNFGEFKENWMAPGFSSKEALSTEEGKRIPLGEKGIGRFAAGKLADRLHVYTKKANEETWLHVYFNWSLFEDMRQPMRNIIIPYDYRSPRDFPYESGTQIVLDGLRTNWLGQVPGPKVSGSAEYRLDRLVEDLSLLLMPFREHANFAIQLKCDARQDLNGVIQRDFLDVAEYAYVFSVKSENGVFRVKRSVRRSEDIANITEKPENEELDDIEIGMEPECGPFAGIFYYIPLDASKARRLNVTPGIKLYRDGFKVEPYGNAQNDWLDVKGWKARRAGYAPIRPIRFFGYVEISGKKNPNLIDTSNREGLVENEAYQKFIPLSRSEFQTFAELIGKEYVKEIKWEESRMKAGRIEASAQLEFLLGMMQVFGHAIRQPLQGIKSEKSVIESIIGNSSLSKDDSKEVKKSLYRVDEYVGRLNEITERLLSLQKPNEIRIFTLSKIVESEIPLWAANAKQRNININLRCDVDEEVTSNELLLREGMNVLMMNALEAFEGIESDNKMISIACKKIRRSKYQISVRDNGRGITKDIKEKLFTKNVSTKGRYGWGLYLLSRQMPLMGGKLELVWSEEGKGCELAIEFRSERG